ncbi:hypothetical protein [Candidatus Palauibacter sp.]
MQHVVASRRIEDREVIRREATFQRVRAERSRKDPQAREQKPDRE